MNGRLADGTSSLLHMSDEQKVGLSVDCWVAKLHGDLSGPVPPVGLGASVQCRHM